MFVKFHKEYSSRVNKFEQINRVPGSLLHGCFRFARDKGIYLLWWVRSPRNQNASEIHVLSWTAHISAATYGRSWVSPRPQHWFLQPWCRMHGVKNQINKYRQIWQIHSGASDCLCVFPSSLQAADCFFLVMSSQYRDIHLIHTFLFHCNE